MKKIVNKEETNKEKELVSSESCENKKGSNNKLWFINWSVFLVIGVFLFLLVQRILMPRWGWPRAVETISWSIDEFNNLKEDSVDVVFVGVSHMQYGISPMEIYKEYGIVSYNLATSAQPLDMTYYMLEEAFKRQSPSYVVLDASNFYFSVEEYGDSKRRNVLDSMPLSKEKIVAAKEYSEMTSDKSSKNKMERFNSIILPIIQYHTNWKSLYADNFSFTPRTDYCTAGYVMSPIKGQAYTDKEGLEKNTDDILNDNKRSFVTVLSNGELKTYEREESLYNPEIIPEQREMVKKINELCRKNNAKLIIVKLPVITYAYNYSSAWTRVKYEMTKDLAEEIGAEYFDFLFDSDIDLDINKDFHDIGYHLNYNGAVKASKIMGEYLSDNYGIGNKTCAFMDEHMATYEKMAEIATIQIEPDFYEYAKFLKEHSDDYIVCIAAREYWKENLTKDEEAALNILGLYSDIKEYSDTGNSYVAIIDSGNVEFEQISNRRISYFYENAGKTINVVSEGASCGNLAEVRINETDDARAESVAINGNGLNIVVIDKATNTVMDSCYIDTNSEDEKYHILTHSDNSYHYLNDYIYGDN